MNILFTSVGRRGYLLRWFRVALEGRGLVHAANSDPRAPALAAADRWTLSPLIHSDEYIGFLLDYCRRFDIGAIVPLFDLDVTVLSQSIALFAENGVRLVVSDAEATRICNDKNATFEFLRGHGVHTPHTVLSPAEALEAVAAQTMAFPLVVKPRWGLASIGLHVAEDENELAVLFRKAQREVERSPIRTQGDGEEGAILIQTAVRGVEHGLDVVNDLDGNYACTFARRKLAMRSGETDAAVTVAMPALSALGATLGRLLRHVANLDVDLFVDGTDISVLEMNARFGGGYPFSHLAGADVPRAVVAWLRGEEADPAWLTVRAGVEGVKDVCPMLRDWG